MTSPRPPAPARLLAGLQHTLASVGIDYDAVVLEFGQVAACEGRERGHRFTLRDHVRGLLLSLLSNQRPWGPIAANMERLQVLFRDFDPDALEAVDPEVLGAGLRELRCGNRAVAKQMASLAENIRTLRRIESEYGSIDKFVTSADPDAIALRLSRPCRYKLRQVGYTLALEYLRNVGIRAAKPDLHVRRIISGDRLGYTAGYPPEQEAQRVIADLALAAGCNPTYLDNLLWLFCAQDYGSVCGAQPRCEICAFAGECNYP